MKFESNWANGLIYGLIHNMSDLARKGKGQPCPCKLIYSHCLISFNISSKNNDLGFNSIQKINFQKKCHLNGLGISNLTLMLTMSRST